MKSWLNRNVIDFCSTSFIFLIISFVPALQAMEQGAVISNGATALHIVLQHGLKIFGHKNICALAVTNTSYRKFICDSAESIKNYFIHLQPHLESLDNITWNSYGTACARASCGCKLNWSLYQGTRTQHFSGKISELLIERRFIFGPNFIPDYHAWKYCYQELPHKPRVSFNGTQDVYIHAYGGMGGDVKGNVVEYRLLSNGKHDALRCVTEINGKLIPLNIFLEFPSLLQAFLESTIVKRITDTTDKVFMLVGIIVPACYKECRQYLREQTYWSFEDLPKKIQKAIVALYKQQKEAAKKKQKMSCFGFQ